MPKAGSCSPSSQSQSERAVIWGDVPPQLKICKQAPAQAGEKRPISSASIVSAPGASTGYSGSTEREMRAAKEISSVFSRYGLSILITALALTLSFRLSVASEAPFVLFLGGVIASAVYGGLGPAALNLFLSIEFMNFFFVPPYYRFSFSGADLEDLLSLTVFTMVSLICGCLVAGCRRAKENLQASEKRYRCLVTAASEAIIELGDKEEIVFASPAAQKLLGISLDQMLGQKLSLLLGSDSDRGQMSPERGLPLATYQYPHRPDGHGRSAQLRSGSEPVASGLSGRTDPAAPCN